MNEVQRKNKWFRENGNTRKRCSECGRMFVSVKGEELCGSCTP
jgi:hypothetical protein